MLMLCGIGERQINYYEILCSVDCASLYILVNETNLVHYILYS